LFLLLFGTLPVLPAGYRILDLGNLGGGFARARDVNEAGVIVGESLIPVVGAVERAFCWEAGVMTDLGTLGGARSRALAVNNTGVVAGWAVDAGNTVKPVLWDNGGIVPLPTLGGTFGTAWSINDSAVAVGHSSLPGGVYHATRWGAGGAEDLGTLGGSYSVAYDINSSGLIVGTADASGGVQRACLWDSAGLVDLGALSGGSWNTARAINDSGAVVLWGTPAGVTENRAAFWSGHPEDPVVDLGTFGGGESWAYGLNNLGHVVGWAELAAGHYHAYVWNGVEMVDLGTLGGLFSSAYAINDAGVVVGWAHDAAGRTRAVAWIPVPEPVATLLASATVLFAVGLVHRRQVTTSACAS
jgi:probable HAF family extracellular repeat protein